MSAIPDDASTADVTGRLKAPLIAGPGAPLDNRPGRRRDRQGRHRGRRAGRSSRRRMSC